jgi:type I restriction enzyme S subunit
MREGWTIEPLSEVCQIKPPKSQARKNLSPNDLVSFIPMRDLHVRCKDLALNEERPLAKVAGSYTYFANNDVLLAKITPCFENGKLGIARNLKNGVGFGSSEYIVFRSNGRIDPDYLFYFLSRDSFRDAGAKVMTGAVGHKRVSKEFIEALKIPIPPLAEQKRIVALLDETFAGIAVATAAATKNLKNARELFETTLNTTFTQKGEGWVTQELNQNVKFIDYRGKTPPKRPEGIRLITAKNVKMGFIQRKPEEFIDESAYDAWMTRGFPQFGDVLFTTEAPLGKIAQLDTHETVVIGQRLITMQPVPEILDATFLKFILMSQVTQKEILARGTGATVLGIKAKLLKQIPIHFPKRVSEQERIVSRLNELSDETQRLEALYQQKIDALGELKQSLLQKAFAGELTATPELLEAAG